MFEFIRHYFSRREKPIHPIGAGLRAPQRKKYCRQYLWLGVKWFVYVVVTISGLSYSLTQLFYSSGFAEACYWIFINLVIFQIAYLLLSEVLYLSRLIRERIDKRIIKNIKQERYKQ